MQQLLRIHDASLKNDVQRLQDEYNNPAHEYWQPIAVARATILPVSKSNSVLQLNLGQGKTSVIMPMVACPLANGRNLARLIVPKALLLQTAQIIQSRLGGLSLAANGLQCLSDLRLESASRIISITDWLTRVCRVVVDESGFSLAVKTQLIYPSGSQLPLDGHPYRWKIAHALLNLVKEHLEEAQQEFPESFELTKRTNDGFLFIHILRPDVESFIHQRLADDLCSGRASILSTPAVGHQQALRSFISNGAVDQSVVTAAMQAFVEPAAIKKMFLLRGLLGHGILLQCLKKVERAVRLAS
ncbi:uncharacterized protein ATNIH1004_011810 [Aspergillus tanneri]|uniref:ubiquitinyl hydrolase 1 n=1 Tax=Aspergillus tanneri TaxID=1220188 RepID=A0A5M9M8K2_9EURO|nr:uncharacterized protein ATNIH1004_011810 [Aspergillus tanneri]KAA8641674.1 hypothetical protein ATNIH1004_011810 [Aspergillus tanneri]